MEKYVNPILIVKDITGLESSEIATKKEVDISVSLNISRLLFRKFGIKVNWVTDQDFSGWKPWMLSTKPRFYTNEP